MFPRINVLEILDIEIDEYVADYFNCSTQDDWKRLDVVLSRGFLWRRRVTISVVFLFRKQVPKEHRC